MSFVNNYISQPLTKPIRPILEVFSQNGDQLPNNTSYVSKTTK